MSWGKMYLAHLLVLPFSSCSNLTPCAGRGRGAMTMGRWAGLTRWGSAKTQRNSLRIATCLSPQPPSDGNDIRGQQGAHQPEDGRRNKDRKREKPREWGAPENQKDLKYIYFQWNKFMVQLVHRALALNHLTEDPVCLVASECISASC